jgi:cell division transport system permease protein
MVRDDRSDPPSIPPAPGARAPTPRDLRASLSSSLGLGDGRRGASRFRVEPHLGGDPSDLPSDAWAATDPRHAPEPPLAGTAATTNPGSLSPAMEPAAPELLFFEGTPSEAAERQPPPRAAASGRGRDGSSAVSRTDAKVAVAAKAGVPASAAPKGAAPAQASRSQTIVPPQAVAGRALVSVVAIMCFLACLAVGTLSLVIGAAHDWQLDVSREVTIQVKPVEGTAMPARLARALDIARATTGVRSARLVSEAESAALLEPWLGQGLDLSSLPIPRLVVIDLGDPAGADLAGLKRRIGAEVTGAVVDDHAVWAARLRTMAGAVVAVGVMIVLLVFVAMVLSVVFATQSAMAGNREVIEVLHFVGAEDSFIARQFQRHFLELGLVGGTIGGVAAIVCFLAADVATRSTRGDALADQAHALFGGFSVGLGGHLAAAAVVGVVAVLTAITSRATVLGHLRRID